MRARPAKPVSAARRGGRRGRPRGRRRRRRGGVRPPAARPRAGLRQPALRAPRRAGRRRACSSSPSTTRPSTTSQLQWPFPRSRHGQAIDRLRRDGASAIVYDVQFTEQTTPREDNALIDAVGARAQRRAGHRGDRRARPQQRARRRRAPRRARRPRRRQQPAGRPGWRAAALPRLGRRAARRWRWPPPAASVTRPRRAPSTTAAPGSTSAARPARSTPSRSPISSTAASIPRACAGGSSSWAPSAPTLQDVHPTPTASGELMSGPEIEANAIYTATHGLPLRDVPRWVEPAGHPRARPAARAGQPARARAAGRAARARAPPSPGSSSPSSPSITAACWRSPRRSSPSRSAPWPPSPPATSPSAAGAIASRCATRRSRRPCTSARAELRETQLEIIQRLAAATESRDEETGLHLERIGLLCERVGLVLGLTAAEAETLRHASLLHDVGKIAVPDAILTKPGKLTDEEWVVMRRHAEAGAAILVGLARADHAHGRGDRAHPPRALGRRRLPAGPGRRGDPARGAHLRGVRRLRRAALAAALQGAVAACRTRSTSCAASAGSHFDPAVVDAFMTLVDDLDPLLLDGPPGARNVRLVR